MQAVQTPRIALGGVVEYGVALGLSVVLRAGVAPVGMRQPVHVAFALGGSADGFYLGVNVLALVALILVARWQGGALRGPEQPSRQLEFAPPSAAHHETRRPFSGGAFEGT